MLSKPYQADSIPCLSVHRYDERLELAPRDIVARAIHDQLQTHGDKHVLLDISHRPSAEVLAHFPNIAAECGKAGIDVTKDPIPVVPAQHYMCGGVRTGLYGAHLVSSYSHRFCALVRVRLCVRFVTFALPCTCAAVGSMPPILLHCLCR